LPVLTDIGRTDVAYRLIQNTTYPSWGYSIEQGATTIWERWDSYTREKGFGDVNMNSFNHYAYGSCGEWMYRTLAGIDAAEPGFRRITIRPIPGEGVDHMDAHYVSVRGMIRTAWRKTPTRLFLDVTVPLNTVAEIHVPVRDVGSVQEGGRQAILAKELVFLRKEAGAAVFEAGSGVYRFTAPR
jgi:hypothetical protein